MAVVMPLLDHLAPPLATARRWEGFHNGWAEHLATSLNEVLPPGYVAEPNVRYGPRLQIDVLASETSQDPVAPPMSEPPIFRPGGPTAVVPATYPDTFEVRVSRTGPEGSILVAAVELVSPSNKDRPAARRSFASKCAAYLAEGMGVVVVDVVTVRQARLHDELLALLDVPGARLPADADLSACAYRPVRRGERNELELWVEPLRIGAPLPTLPLWIATDVAVPLHLEATYRETCRRHRIDLDRLAAESG
jgi:hypothetical protein